jgi:hypothetical protein
MALTDHEWLQQSKSFAKGIDFMPCLSFTCEFFPPSKNMQLHKRTDGL